MNTLRYLFSWFESVLSHLRFTAGKTLTQQKKPRYHLGRHKYINSYNNSHT